MKMMESKPVLTWLQPLCQTLQIRVVTFKLKNVNKSAFCYHNCKNHVAAFPGKLKSKRSYHDTIHFIGHCAFLKWWVHCIWVLTAYTLRLLQAVFAWMLHPEVCKQAESLCSHWKPLSDASLSISPILQQKTNTADWFTLILLLYEASTGVTALSAGFNNLH